MANGSDEKKTLKQKAWDTITEHIWKLVLGVVFLFLLNNWLNGFEATVQGLSTRVDDLDMTIKTNTEAQTELNQSVDSLRWQLDDISGDMITSLGDHEVRIRELERKVR